MVPVVIWWCLWWCLCSSHQNISVAWGDIPPGRDFEKHPMGEARPRSAWNQWGSPATAAEASSDLRYVLRRWKLTWTNRDWSHQKILRNLDFARKWEKYRVHSIEKKSGGPIPWFFLLCKFCYGLKVPSPGCSSTLTTNPPSLVQGSIEVLVVTLQQHTIDIHRYEKLMILQGKFFQWGQAIPGITHICHICHIFLFTNLQFGCSILNVEARLICWISPIHQPAIRLFGDGCPYSTSN